MSRSTDTQKVERLNAAHGLLARGISIAEACALLSRQFAMSRRQAYRYLQEARELSAPLPMAEGTVAVTFKLPPSLVAALRTRAAADGATISETVGRALRAYLAGGKGHGPQA